MPSYDYTIAKEVLNEADKGRIVCLYLACEPSAIDWAKATKDFGSASVESFKKTTANMLKKIEKAGGKIEDGAEGSASPDKAAAAAAAAAKPAAKAAPKKRKGKGEVEGEGEGEGEEGGEKPAPKKRGRKAKKADSPVAEGEGEKVAEEVVKAEPEDEGEMV